jgi:hypothetical protein
VSCSPNVTHDAPQVRHNADITLGEQGIPARTVPPFIT